MNLVTNWARTAFKLFAAIFVLAACGNTSADPRTINDGVYSKAQAKVGEQLYRDHCLLCHDKKYFRPIFKRSEGQPLGIMFTVMSTSMPENNPGFLREKEYADILAYILSLSRYTPGDKDLEYEGGVLNDITIAARERK